ncbi:uncharacterized protein [Rutidosis leptorrhynchoides]|uniref:uncharacterized protein n=1 Tax=Rutidosis leptorrhynchoides TaxID=125765 RepID=UPI003A997341
MFSALNGLEEDINDGDECDVNANMDETCDFMAHKDPAIHCLLESVADGKCFYTSFIYAHNRYIMRRPLWTELSMHSSFVGSHQWAILGDFNVSLEVDESSSGSSKVTLAMREFKDCIEGIRMTDINRSGFQFTWNQRPNARTGILKNIDRVMVNDAFLNDFSNAFALLEPYRISDHYTIHKGWMVEVQGCHMFRVVNKLKGLKKPIRKLTWKRGNLHKRVIELRDKLDAAQRNLDMNPNSVDIREAEAECLRNYNEALIEEEITNRTHIQSIEDNDGVRIDGVGVTDFFVKHYEAFLGTSQLANELDAQVFENKIYLRQQKSPGPDGFNAEFFKTSWNIVGEDVTKAVIDFFKNGKLLKQINHTIITLIRKVQSPSKVTDYRPISCCNVLDKCISKIITNRIKMSLYEVVGCNQSAFIPGRRISDNILLTQELMKDYHTNRGVVSCAFKVDIHKAYDTVDWGFLECALRCFGYPDTMVKWIMTCISSTSFSIAVNGDLHGYFKVMEVLSLLLQKRLKEGSIFRFHPKCEKLKIINLCFANDLFLFSHANVDSVRVIAESLNEFKLCSGLVSSMTKSTVFFANVSQWLKEVILAILPFEEGKLPVKYLGVPLVSSSLLYRDCRVLVDRVKSLMRGFLWCQGELSRGKAKVKWSTICLPKDEGGLGVKLLKEWNIALMVSHIWRLITNKHSLWVKWIHEYRIKGMSFWDAPCVAGASVGWRKLLAIRGIVRDRFIIQIGDGRMAFAWHDTWSDNGPLISFISNRDITRAGFSIQAKVHDICVDRMWTWLNEWVVKYPLLSNMSAPSFVDSPNKSRWRNYNGDLQDFYVGAVWESIRHHQGKVPWYNIVWFANCIPKHAFITWLLMGKKLKMQDKLQTWETRYHSGISSVCSLCSQVADSHSHLFFECSFASQIWNYSKSLSNVAMGGSQWQDVVACIGQMAAQKTSHLIVAKLLFGASVYFIWQERNRRLFF